MSRRHIRILLWTVLTAVLTITAYLLVNTTFMPYDDEGYVLISLRNYLSGLRLYDDVFSQYGPWPYVYHELITSALHVTVTHALGRLLTVFHWVGTALMCGWLGWRLTRNQFAATASAALVFGLMWQNTSEPSHPGSHIAFLISVAVVLVSYLADTRRPVLVYAALGTITGLLLLTKINVGLLLAAGLGCFALRHTAWPDRFVRPAGLLAVAGILAVPWVLLGRQLDQGWVQIFAMEFTFAAAGILWVTPTARLQSRLPMAALVAAPLACLVTMGLIVFRVWQHGTSLASLFNAILISPLRMPAKFMVGVTWYPEVWVLTAVGAVAVAKAGWDLRRTGELSQASQWLVAVLRVIVLIGFVLHAREWPSYYGIFHFTACCLPLLPVFAVPLAGGLAKPSLALTGVALVAVAQVLHAFPVAGSQLAWATFLCVPVLVAGMFELPAILPRLLPATGWRLGRAVTALLAAAACYQLGLLAYTGGMRYTHSRPLDLPGSGDIRLDGSTRQAMRLLNLNARIHADLLFSRQGMFSHNLWSGVPTPTAQNCTHWFWLLNDRQQREIVDRLAATPRTALINSHSLDAFMIERKIPVAGPLQDFAQQHYRPLFSYGDFTFNVPRDSHAIAFGRYQWLESPDQAETILMQTSVLLEGAPASIRLERIEHPWDAGPDLLTPRTHAWVEPIDREGRPTGEAIALPSARPLRGLYKLSVVSPRLPPKLPWQEFAVVVRDAGGNLLSESVY